MIDLFFAGEIPVSVSNAKGVSRGWRAKLVLTRAFEGPLKAFVGPYKDFIRSL